MSDSNERISISHSTLRAELAEMELRLRVWIATELEKKATSVEVSDLRVRVGALEMMITDPRIREMIVSQIELSGAREDAKRWTPRQRGLAILLALLSVSTFITSLQPWTW
jgi:hypothetical protein